VLTSLNPGFSPPSSPLADHITSTARPAELAVHSAAGPGNRPLNASCALGLTALSEPSGRLQAVAFLYPARPNVSVSRRPTGIIQRGVVLSAHLVCPLARRELAEGPSLWAVILYAGMHFHASQASCLFSIVQTIVVPWTIRPRVILLEREVLIQRNPQRSYTGAMSYESEPADAICQSFSPLLVAPASVADVPLLAHPVSPYLPAATQGPITSARGVTAICVDAIVS
jgi:hypothetical protein